MKFSEPAIPKYFLPLRLRSIGKRARVWLGTAIPPGFGKEMSARPASQKANILQNNGFFYCLPAFWLVPLPLLK